MFFVIPNFCFCFGNLKTSGTAKPRERERESVKVPIHCFRAGRLEEDPGSKSTSVCSQGEDPDPDESSDLPGSVVSSMERDCRLSYHLQMSTIQPVT